MNFKSERAAKMAYTKAEKAWDAARSTENRLTWECRDKMRANGGSMDWDDAQKLDHALEKLLTNPLA